MSCVWKAAVTVCELAMSSWHCPVPLQSPPQPTRVDPAYALAKSGMTDPPEKPTEQSGGQSIVPGGSEITVPSPATVTWRSATSGKDGGSPPANEATTCIGALTTRSQWTAAPEHSSDQPTKW